MNSPDADQFAAQVTPKTNMTWRLKHASSAIFIICAYLMSSYIFPDPSFILSYVLGFSPTSCVCSSVLLATASLARRMRLPPDLQCIFPLLILRHAPINPLFTRRINLSFFTPASCNLNLLLYATIFKLLRAIYILICALRILLCAAMRTAATKSAVCSYKLAQPPGWMQLSCLTQFVGHTSITEKKVPASRHPMLPEICKAPGALLLFRDTGINFFPS